MKKLILSVIAASTFANVTYVPQSQAVVGILVGSPVVMGAAVLTVLATGGVGVSSLVFDMVFSRGVGVSTTVVPLAAMGVGLGFVALSNETQSLVYQPVNSTQARSIGMSAAEMAAYNNELDLINVLSDETRYQVEGAQQLNLQTDEEKMKFVSDLKAHYAEVSANLGLSAEALSALGKVSSSSFKVK